MKGNLWQITVIALALVFLVPAASGAFAGATTEDTAVQNSTVDYDAGTQLSINPQDNGNFTEYAGLIVRNTDTETDLDRGTDYEFAEEFGTINYQKTAATTAGDNITVEYGYVLGDQRTLAQAKILRTVGSWIGLLLLIAALGWLVLISFSGRGF